MFDIFSAFMLLVGQPERYLGCIKSLS